MRSLIQASTLTVGTIINSGLGLLFYLLLGRNLSVSNFGYFSFLLGIGILAADLCDMGINASIVKFGHGDNFRSIFTVATLHRLFAGVLLLIVAIIGQFFYPSNFLLSAILAWITLLTYLVLQSFIAKERYFLYSIVNILGNLSRLGILFLFLNLGLLSAEAGIGLFILGSTCTFVFGLTMLIILEKGKVFNTSNLKDMSKNAFRFGGWLGVSYGVSATAAKIDNPLVFYLAGPTSAGLYASAQRVASILPQIASSIDSVFAPKLSKTEQQEEHFKQYLIIAISCSFILLLIIPFANLLLALSFGQKYVPATQIFQIILLGFSLFLISNPFTSSIVYRFGKTKLNFYLSLIQLTIGVLSMSFLIPAFGALGAATSFVIVNATSLTFVLISYYFLNSQKQNG